MDKFLMSVYDYNRFYAKMAAFWAGELSDLSHSNGPQHYANGVLQVMLWKFEIFRG